MSEESVKIRIAGELPQVELLTQKLREWSKQWGNRKIFQVKQYDRKSEGNINKYHRTFGSRRFVNYITLKLPKKLQGIPSNSTGETHERN